MKAIVQRVVKASVTGIIAFLCFLLFIYLSYRILGYNRIYCFLLLLSSLLVLMSVLH